MLVTFLNTFICESKRDDMRIPYCVGHTAWLLGDCWWLQLLDLEESMIIFNHPFPYPVRMFKTSYNIRGTLKTNGNKEKSFTTTKGITLLPQPTERGCYDANSRPLPGVYVRNVKKDFFFLSVAGFHQIIPLCRSSQADCSFVRLFYFIFNCWYLLFIIS